MLNIKEHPQFKKLLIQLSSLDPDLLSQITVSGVPVEINNLILNEVTDISFFYTTNLTQSILTYIDSIEDFTKDQLEYSSLIKLLNTFGFEKSERVSDKKEFSIRGDIITFWPSFSDLPIRIEFFGDEVEQMILYDVTLNKALNKLDKILIPNEKPLEGKNHPIKLINSGKPFSKIILNFNQFHNKADIEFDFRQPPLFFNRFDLLEKFLSKYEADNYKINIFTSHPEQIPENLAKYVQLNSSFASGLISNETKLVYLTDREIFGTIFLKNEIFNNASSSESRKLLSQFEGEVQIGDFVVHEDHGIGLYKGIIQEKSSVNADFPNNYIQIEYAEDDEILVPLNMIYKITKYFGTGEKPILTKLGRGDWINATNKVKASVKLMASELLQHYAKISVAKVDQINNGDSSTYQNFVSQFKYEETEDQLRSIEEIKADLTREKPMNRLLVGDVGFGKTEVIMRAAFKTVEAGKQVVVLAPTTVLTSQHEKVFKDRFKDFGFRIEAVSRFKDQFVNKDVLKDVTDGKVDIIIGTHRLLSNDVEFKNLGLIVIDEEQKFGVKQKEKLRRLEYNAHVLSTSATPIPRTLSMALSSIQDISIIQTPPKNRKPVKTKVEKLDWNIVVKSINAETQRGGQVFLVYNSVKTIFSIAAKLKSLMPNINFAVAHGQMSGDQIEQIMLDFLNKKYDCLISTTIIENGIDISNVNTLIVVKAQNFGLSQLYQLRGRVGRSSQQAFAYFFYEGLDLKPEEDNEEDKKENPEKYNKNYLRRLNALAEVKELGAGFEIAAKDLEIRGAGNLLGKEQHGNINKIGYGLYMQLLSEEIERIKNS